ncbi:hypothetical protein J1N35_028504 [Gossypium stocksii]|uniref:PPM-type phosphatase domain-containing protein n=1 Tax=Gossypium stocksii TaxID=47602 RepID=A0A9D3ZSI2_9ROSI|nr:hypothetical protein J1N35_028504 [Gossypium stocksii]
MKEKVQEKVGLNPSNNAESGKGKSKISRNITHAYHLVKGKTNHPMEDYVSTEFKQVNGSALGLFPIFNGHLSHKLVIANVGYSRAVISKNGVAKQLSVDHEPASERESIENRGGFVLNFPGKPYLVAFFFYGTCILNLRFNGLFLKFLVMSNQEAVDAIKGIKDAQSAEST